MRAPAELDRLSADRDLLVDLSAPQPHLLVPGALDDARRSMLTQALPAGRLAIGLTVPTALACESLRWARRVLELVDSGVIDDAPQIRCEDHLLTLWLLSDPALLDQLAQRELAAVAGISATRRERLVETLRIWLDTLGHRGADGRAARCPPADRALPHAQPETIFGDQLVDPGSRFATEAVLRALRLRSRATDTSPDPDHISARPVNLPARKAK